MMDVLIVDDDSGMRSMLRMVLEKAGYRTREAVDARQALVELEVGNYPLVLCDVRMPEIDGLGLLDLISKSGIETTTIMMSAYGSIDLAIKCLKKGAYDYISKPFKPDEVVLTLKKAEERLQLICENRQLKKQIGQSKALTDIVHQSSSMRDLLVMVERVARAMSPVLVTGETGTGKELIAQAIHAAGPRQKEEFVAVNCSALAPQLLESELFGHAKGAFTGADRARQGLFQAADGGTLFLDEIGELPLELQPKLLRVLQEGEVRRVGETHPRKVDVRLVVATARDLRREVEEGRFRDDLFYRLAVVELQVPPLRRRRSDIPPLARHFLARQARCERRSVPQLSQAAEDALQAYDWPGNVRELENFMAKTMIFCRQNQVDLVDLPWEFRRQERSRQDDLSLKQAMARLEEEYIRKALHATAGNRTQAAKLLEISLRALMYKLKDLNLS